MAAFLLPLAFNPFAAFPFELTKVNILRGTASAMMVITLLPPMLVRERRVSKASTKLGVSLRDALSSNPLAFAVLSYAAVYLLATVFSIDRGLSLLGRGNGHGALTTLMLLSLYFLLSASLKRRHVTQMISILVAGSVPVALYGWLQYLGFDPLGWKSASISAVHSTMGRSVFLGAYLSMLIPYTLSRLLQINLGGWRRIAHLLVLLLQTSCLTLTLARGAWVGLVGGLILFWYLMADSKPMVKWGMLAFTVAAVFALGLIAFSGELILRDGRYPNLSERVDGIRSGSNSVRITTWVDALKLVPDRWILGYGPESYPTALEIQGVIDSGSAPAWWHQDDPHNILLWQLTSVGLAGLLAYLWIIGRFFRASFRSLVNAKSADDRTMLVAISCSTFVYLIAAQFNPDVIVTTTFFWLNLAMGSANLYERS